MTKAMGPHTDATTSPSSHFRVALAFDSAAQEAMTNSRRAVESRVCPDQYVGQISEIERLRRFPVRVPANNRPKDVPCVIMVLESPHKDEYSALKLDASGPRPANGNTGINIARWVASIPELRDFSDAGLLLVNAIPYQCSLGANPAAFRDEVFRKVWHRGGYEHLVQRIQTLYVPGDRLLSCCTRGARGEDGQYLRELVLIALRNALPTVEILCRTHPANWKGQLGIDWSKPKELRR